MQLTDPREIELIIRGGARLNRRRVPKPEIQEETVYESPKLRAARCACGRCYTCKENLRWERIFNEKFADPDYYKPRLKSPGSSLAWLA